MEGVESKSESQGQDGQIASENSIRLAENLQGFQQCVKEILNLTQKEEEFSEVTAQIYDSKKSKFTSNTPSPIKTHHVDPSTSQEAQGKKFQKQIDLNLAEISKRDEQITELNKQISLLKNSLAAQEDRLNADIEKLEEKIRANTEETMEVLRLELDSKEARNRELNEEVNGFKAIISNRDDAIEELNDKIAQMTVAHAAEKDRLNTEINMLNAEIGEMTELVVGWKQKHDVVTSYTNEVKAKVAELGRVVMKFEYDVSVESSESTVLTLTE